VFDNMFNVVVCVFSDRDNNNDANFAKSNDSGNHDSSVHFSQVISRSPSL